MTPDHKLWPLYEHESWSVQQARWDTIILSDFLRPEEVQISRYFTKTVEMRKKQPQILWNKHIPFFFHFGMSIFTGRCKTANLNIWRICWETLLHHTVNKNPNHFSYPIPKPFHSTPPLSMAISKTIPSLHPHRWARNTKNKHNMRILWRPISAKKRKKTWKVMYVKTKILKS